MHDPAQPGPPSAPVTQMPQEMDQFGDWYFYRLIWLFAGNVEIRHWRNAASPPVESLSTSGDEVTAGGRERRQWLALS